MKKKNTPFYQDKWFKFTCCIAFFGFVAMNLFDNSKIESDELATLEVTIKGEVRSGGKRNKSQFYFNVREFKNRLHIKNGGTFGRYSAVKNILQSGTTVSIKIRKSDKWRINMTKDDIPIYYLKHRTRGLIFDERAYDEGDHLYRQRLGVMLFFLFGLMTWSIFSK